MVGKRTQLPISETLAPNGNVRGGSDRISLAHMMSDEGAGAESLQGKWQTSVKMSRGGVACCSGLVLLRCFV